MRCLTFSILITTLISNSAQANEQGADDEIIVTASRQAQNTREYAGSISVISEQALQNTNPAHPSVVLNRAAGVNIQRGSGQEHLTAIRSPVLTGGAGAGSFLYLEDGVPLRAAGFSNVNGLFEGMVELASKVEITKGPGSVLYGSNAEHGLINILSQAPTDKRDLSLDILGNEDGYVRLKAGGNGATLGGHYHIGVNLAHAKGWREASGFDQQKLQIRHDGELSGWSSNTLFSFQNLNQETAGFIKGFEAYKDLTTAKSNPNPEAFRDGRTARLSVTLNKTLDSGQTLSLIPYVRSVNLSFRRHFVPGKALEDSGHDSVGLLVKYDKSKEKVGMTLGLDTEYTNGFLHEYQPGPSVFSFIQGEHFNYRVRSLVLSPYAQIRNQLGAHTHLNIGLRADTTQYSYHNKINSGQFGRFIRIPDRTDTFVTLSPKVGLTHDLSSALTLYGRLARGARAPQVTDAYSLQINQSPGEIKPETLDSAELGLKGHIGPLRMELAAYLMRKNHFFFRNANGFNVADGKTKHKGIEVSFNTPVGEMFHAAGAFTWADHRYNFTDLTRSASSSIHTGDPVDTAPKTLGFLEIEAHPTDTISLAVKWRHVGAYQLDPGNTASYPGHDIFDLRGGINFGQNVQIYGRLDNLFNTRYADRADFAFGSYRYFPGRPRTLFLGLRYKG